MDPTEFIAEQRIQDGIDEGLFDGLPGAGAPIGDIDDKLDQGWWAARFLQNGSAEARRNEVARDQVRLDSALRVVGDHIEARRLLAEHNEKVATCNLLSRRSTLEPLAVVDIEAVMREWHRDRIATRRR